MAFGTFVIPDFSGALYQNSLLVQAQGQLVLTAYIISQITHFVNDVLFVGEFSIERAKQYGEKDVEDIVKKGFFYLSERSTTDNLNRKALESGLNKHFSVSPFD